MRSCPSRRVGSVSSDTLSFADQGLDGWRRTVWHAVRMARSGGGEASSSTLVSYGHDTKGLLGWQSRAVVFNGPSRLLACILAIDAADHRPPQSRTARLFLHQLDEFQMRATRRFWRGRGDDLQLLQHGQDLLPDPHLAGVRAQRQRRNSMRDGSTCGADTQAAGVTRCNTPAAARVG